MKLEILRNENAKEYEETIIEEAKAEGQKGSLIRATKLSSFRAGPVSA